MRLFIAINFDDDTRKNLINLQNRLRKISTGSFSHPENLHLTLAFLGEVNPERVVIIQKIMDQLTFSTLHLSFDHAGRFKRRDGDLWWVGLAQNEVLSIMQRDLCDQLSKAGFPLEERPFSPHITLARRVKLNKDSKDSKDNNGLKDINMLLETPFPTKIDQVSLMLSEHINGKLTYTEQYKVRSQNL